MDLPIAIIGGGIAGLTCSIGLSRHGKAHKIYESAACFQSDGAGIALSPNGMAALEEIDPRLRECVEVCATRNYDESKSWLTYRHGMAVSSAPAVDVVHSGTAGFGSIIADVQAYGRTEAGRSCFHRWSLVDQMVRLIPAGIAEFSKQLIGLDDDGNAVKLIFQDGTVSWASAVLACDGIRSVVRRAALNSDPASIEPAFSGEYCYRRLVPMLEARNILGDNMARNGSIFCGYDAYVTTYPVVMENHEFVNMTAVRRHCDGGWPEPEVWRQTCSQESMLQDFEGWGSPIIQLLNGIKKPEKWALFDLQATKTYATGRVCLLGDAAHASTPHQGAGAAMAIEDACTISHLLRGAQSPQDFEECFSVFDRVRRPRTQRLVVTSRAAGRVFEFRHEELMDHIDRVRENLMVRHSWIWNFDIRRDLKEADRQLKALSSSRAVLPSLLVS